MVLYIVQYCYDTSGSCSTVGRRDGHEVSQVSHNNRANIGPYYSAMMRALCEQQAGVAISYPILFILVGTATYRLGADRKRHD